MAILRRSKQTAVLVGKTSGFIDSGFVKKMAWTLEISIFKIDWNFGFLLFKCDVLKALATRFEWMNGIFGEAKVYQVLALLNKILIHPMNKFELIDGMMTIAGVEVDARAIKRTFWWQKVIKLTACSQNGCLNDIGHTIYTMIEGCGNKYDYYLSSI